MGFVSEAVVEGQRISLPTCRLHEARLAEPHGDAPETGHRLQITLAGIVEHIGAVAPLDHQGADLLMTHRVGIGVQMIGDVARFSRVHAVSHVRTFPSLDLSFGSIPFRFTGSIVVMHSASSRNRRGPPGTGVGRSGLKAT